MHSREQIRHPAAETPSAATADQAAFSVVAGLLLAGFLLLVLLALWKEPKPPLPLSAGADAGSGNERALPALRALSPPPLDPLPPAGQVAKSHAPALTPTPGAEAPARRRYLARAIEALEDLDAEWQNTASQARSAPAGSRYNHVAADLAVERLLKQIAERKVDPLANQEAMGSGRSLELPETQHLLNALDAYEAAARRLQEYLASGDPDALVEADRLHLRAIAERDSVHALLTQLPAG